MRLAVLGYGKMGRLIARIASDRGHSVVSLNPEAQDADHNILDRGIFTDIDACIEFSTPGSVLDNISEVLASGTPLVVGTTGWYDSLPEVRALVESSGTGFVYASNFSPGVNIFFRVVEFASKLLDRFPEYDVAGLELHHNQKKDSPSGTASDLANIVVQSIERKTHPIFEVIDRPIDPAELQFTSVRCGNIPGTHELHFDSSADTISLSHTARNREGFALGAVQAAEWIQQKVGFFTIDDIMAELMPIEA